jgi:hypothetical protein
LCFLSTLKINCQRFDENNILKVQHKHVIKMTSLKVVKGKFKEYLGKGKKRKGGKRTKKTRNKN